MTPRNRSWWPRRPVSSSCRAAKAPGTTEARGPTERSTISVRWRRNRDHVGPRKKDKLRELLSFVYPTAEGLILKGGTLVEHNV